MRHGKLAIRSDERCTKRTYRVEVVVVVEVSVAVAGIRTVEMVPVTVTVCAVAMQTHAELITF